MRLIVASLLILFLRCYQWFHSLKSPLTDDEREKIFKYRYNIYFNEFAFQFKLTDVHQTSMYDEWDFANNTIIIYATRKNEIIGTIRLVIWQKNDVPEDIKHRYNLDENLLKQLNIVGELRYFQISKKYRRSLLGLALLDALYAASNKNPAMMPDMIIFDTFIGLVPAYQQSGAYIYTRKTPAEGVYLVPLAINPYDVPYLKQAKSVTRFLATWYLYLAKKKTTREQYLQKAKTYIDRIPHYPLYLTKEQIDSYRSHLETEEMRVTYDFFILSLKNVIALTIPAKTTLAKKDMVDIDMFFLLKGVVGVFINKKEVARLHAGDIVGEISMFHPEHTRRADLKSLTEIELLFIPRSLLFKIIKKDPKKAIKLLQTLCINLSYKLIKSNTKLIKLQKTLDSLTHEE